MRESGRTGHILKPIMAFAELTIKYHCFLVTGMVFTAIQHLIHQIRCRLLFLFLRLHSFDYIFRRFKEGILFLGENYGSNQVSSAVSTIEFRRYDIKLTKIIVVSDFDGIC